MSRSFPGHLEWSNGCESVLLCILRMLLDGPGLPKACSSPDTTHGTAINADQARGGFGGQCRHIWHTWSVWGVSMPVLAQFCQPQQPRGASSIAPYSRLGKTSSCGRTGSLHSVPECNQCSSRAPYPQSCDWTRRQTPFFSSTKVER